MSAAEREGEREREREEAYDEEADLDHQDASEDQPLLAQEEQEPDEPHQSRPQRERSAESLLRRLTSSSIGSGKKSTAQRRWPSLLALLILCLVAILIMVFAFFAPSVVEQYATQAVVFEPTSLSIDSFTASGVRARIQGDFRMDASRVEKKPVRDLGRFGTWIAHKAESGESDVEVSLPEYGNVVLGKAHVPGIIVDIRNGHTTHVDFLSDLEPGSKDGIRRIANDWIDGRLGQLRVLGKAEVPLKSGIFRFGTQSVRQELLFANKDIPTIPAYDIKKMNVHETEDRAMAADVTLSVLNEYPVDFSIPSLGFQVLVEDCRKDEPYIMVAEAITHPLHIRPKENIEVKVTGTVRQLPDLLMQDCPGSNKSPLDMLLGNYMRGEENTIYVRGSPNSPGDTPEWVSRLISDIVVPVPVPGKTMGHLIKKFMLDNTHFSIPDPFADPDTPESMPRISAKVKALIALPEEMNFNISANRVRADADVFYKGDKLGKLDLHKWQAANSSRIPPSESSGEGPELLVESIVDEAPLNITDNNVFTDVIQALLFGSESVMMHIKADVDVQVETALGEFRVRKIPAEGEVPVKPIAPPKDGNGDDGDGKGYAKYMPKINDLHIVNTSSTSLTLAALVNLTNPTEYSASVPYIDIHIIKNGSLLGHATARNMEVQPGRNDNLLVHAVYAPSDMGGADSAAIGRELLSQYISGYNTTITLRTHVDSVPSQPSLGKALANFPIEVPTPRLGPRPPPHDGDGDDDDPDDPDDEDRPAPPNFIQDATMHLFTSTATFTLLSPLAHSTIFITSINATALYEDDEVGHIVYELPFAVPPVNEDGEGVQTPRLPVDWSLGSVGYDAVKNALGGTLGVDAVAEVGVRVGRWREHVWFEGSGIGAKVRL